MNLLEEEGTKPIRRSKRISNYVALSVEDSNNKEETPLALTLLATPRTPLLKVVKDNDSVEGGVELLKEPELLNPLPTDNKDPKEEEFSLTTLDKAYNYLDIVA